MYGRSKQLSGETQAVEVLRRSGWKAKPQRVRVARALRYADGHLAVGEMRGTQTLMRRGN